MRVLNNKEKLVFLDLVAKLASRPTFQRMLDLSPNEVEHFKKELAIESQEEARRLYRKLDSQDDPAKKEAVAIAETQKAREAESKAQERLDATQVKTTKKKKRLDPVKVKQQDAKRQKKLAASLEAAKKEALANVKSWRLPMFGTLTDNMAIIERFRKDIVNCGLTFCTQKYGATSTQVKAEASRLDIRINWDTVRR